MKVLLFLVVLEVIIPQSIEINFTSITSFPTWGPPADNVCVADDDSCRCCMMTQKVNALNQTLKQKLDALEAVLTSTSQIYNNLTTKHSAFSAAMFLNPYNFRCLGPFANNRTIVFENVFFNMGTNYNVSSGIYTAPFSGVYSLSVSVFHDASQGTNDLSCVYVMINGIMTAGSSDNHQFDHQDSTTVSFAVRLQAGDKVEVKLKAGCLLCMEISNYNIFSGFLLYAE